MPGSLGPKCSLTWDNIKQVRALLSAYAVPSKKQLLQVMPLGRGTWGVREKVGVGERRVSVGLASKAWSRKSLRKPRKT